MKFCYIDESGTGSEPYAIMVSTIVDATRMHVAKKEWKELLKNLSGVIKRTIDEFHMRDFYSGNGKWRNIDGPTRSEIISLIINWFKNDRKHSVSFSGINKELYRSLKASDTKLKETKSIWCMLALHQILVVQKYFNNEKKNKGNTAFIFDEEVREETNLIKLVNSPPAWTDTYYKRGKKQEQLDQVIDVPYFSDSRGACLLQMSDLIAYILRRHVEIQEDKSPLKYSDEKQKIETWVNTIVEMSLPKSTRYMSKGRDECSDFFYKYAPASLRDLG
ncbi:MAG: DUF3800 domain-containing protein [bacterium]